MVGNQEGLNSISCSFIDLGSKNLHSPRWVVQGNSLMSLGSETVSRKPNQKLYAKPKVKDDSSRSNS